MRASHLHAHTATHPQPPTKTPTQEFATRFSDGVCGDASGRPIDCCLKLGKYAKPVDLRNYTNDISKTTPWHVAKGCNATAGYCSTGEAGPNVVHKMHGLCVEPGPNGGKTTYAALVKVVRGKAAPPCRCATGMAAPFSHYGLEENTRFGLENRCAVPEYSRGCGGHPQGYTPIWQSANSTDVKGADLRCNSAAYCKKCGGLDAVQTACLERRTCFGFTYDAASECGYLKSNATATRGAREGWASYELCFATGGSPPQCGARLLRFMPFVGPSTQAGIAPSA